MWCSDQLSDVDFSDDKTSFYAKNLAVELSDDGNTYTIKSLVNEATIVNLAVTRTAPGFNVGKDGSSYFGSDPKAPWGRIRHGFWMRASVSGTITTADGAINFKGNALFVHALQGMKPHHAAAKWKFCNFQSENYSAFMMEFITPASYGNTTVTVGGLTKGNELVTAGSSGKATWTKVKADTVSGWSPPEAAKFEWSGKSKDGKDVIAVIDTTLSDHFDRVDIMAEVPGFVKSIVAGAAGTRPFIYQVCLLLPPDLTIPGLTKPQYPNTPTALTIKIGDEEITEQGTLYAEATFISE